MYNLGSCSFAILTILLLIPTCVSASVAHVSANANVSGSTNVPTSDNVAAKKCDFQNKTFTSIESAVFDLSHCYLESSLREDREYMAAILNEADIYSVIVQQGTRSRDHVSLKFNRRVSQLFVAMWHTHGAPGLARDLFSVADTTLVNKIQIPFYLTDPTGQIRRYDPGAAKNRTSVRLGHSMRRAPKGTSSGVVIGRISPWGYQNHQPLTINTSEVK